MWSPVLIVLLSLGGVYAGFASPKPIDKPALQKALNINKAKWEATGITEYILKQRVVCFCPVESTGPFDITVKQGVIQDVQYSSDSQLTGTPNRSNLSLLTIKDAFQKIQDALNRNPAVASLSVEYDLKLGYITSFGIDFDLRIADEEQGSSFELLKILAKGPTGPIIPVPPITLPSPVPSIPFPSPKPLPTPSPLPFSPLPPLPSIPPIGNDALIKVQLKLNRQKWISVRPKTYKYRLRRLCFCAPGFVGPFLVSVTGTEVTNVIFEGTQSVSQPPTDIPTIDGLFTIIEEAISEPNKAASVEVKYVPSNGVPKSISIDRIAQAIDDEITYTAELL